MSRDIEIEQRERERWKREESGSVCVCMFFICVTYVWLPRVAIGVKHFKEGDLDKALKMFHHALDIDPCNVEGLVARGAL